MFLVVQQTDGVERRPDPAANLALCKAGNDHGQGNIFEHRTILEQLVVLENHADLPAVGRDTAKHTPKPSGVIGATWIMLI